MERLLVAARDELDMDVLFLSEFTDDRRLFRFANGNLERFAIIVGDGDPLETTYCQRVVNGTLDSLIPDTSTHPVVSSLPITQERGIGCYIGIPVVFSNGEVYGTLCCFNRDPRSDVGQRELAFMQVLASVVAEQIEDDARSERDWRDTRRRLLQIIDANAMHMLFQPIVSLDDNRLLGMEALARFAPDPDRPPDVWFNEAWDAGIGAHVELAAVRTALSAMELMPPDTFLAVNVSHETLAQPALLDEIVGCAPDRVVIEITEHAEIHHYAPVRDAIADLRDLGVRLAIDDWGTGYAGMSHLIELRPDLLKVDHSFIRDLDGDPLHRAATRAVATLGHAIDAVIVAEGIETQGQVDDLRSLGIDAGQGFHLGPPAPL